MTSTQDQTSQSSSALPEAGTYAVDAVHSHVGFVARHLVASKVRGSFAAFDGTIVIGTTPETSSVTATVKADSIATNQEQRDEHLRSSDFLESATYPELTLVSKRIAPSSDGHFELVVDLSIKGNTKEVTFDLEFLGQGPGMAPNTTVVGFEATASIDRRDFDVNFDRALENGSFIIGNKIDLEIAIEASKEN
jgi:polyisoprenoid-binding protein YceI